MKDLIKECTISLVRIWFFVIDNFKWFFIIGLILIFIWVLNNV